MTADDLLITEAQTSVPGRAGRVVVLAHGASAPMDSAGMELLATGLSVAGLRAVRFEFPYMQRRRATGKGGGPDRPAVLEETWLQVIELVAADTPAGRAGLIVGGRSMGGRIASMVADQAGVGAVACYGYPFHPPGKPENLRTAHLESISTPVLIVQGEKDAFGKPDEVAGYALADTVRVHWLPATDHSFRSAQRSGRTQESNAAEAVAETVAFVEELD